MMTEINRIPAFTIHDPIYYSWCKFYIHHPAEQMVKVHPKFHDALRSDGQVERAKKGANEYILWVGPHDNLRGVIATLSHECQHLAGMVLTYIEAYPKDAHHQEILIRLHDFYFEKCLDKLVKDGG